MFPLLFSILTSTAFATPPQPPVPPGSGQEQMGGGQGGEDEMMQHWSEIADELKLDDKQRDALEKLYYDSRMARADLQAKEEKARLELEHQMLSTTFDEKATTKAFESQMAAEGELRRNRFNLQVGLRKVLTADQWKELAAMRSERRQESRDGRKGAPGGQGGSQPPPVQN